MNALEWLSALLAAIPSAVIGFAVWRTQRRISRQEHEVMCREDSKEEWMLLLVQSTGAAIALGEATAKAVQRIPDAHCNGDMHAALDYATKMKHEQKDFLSKQGIHALWDE